MRHLFVALGLAGLPALCVAKAPVCDHWPTVMAESVLIDAGVTTREHVAESKTQAVRLASEQIGKDLYQQVYHITFHEKAGRAIEVITSSKASYEECSMGSVDVFIVSRKLNSDAPIPKD